MNPSIFEPLPCPGGWTIAPPDFVGIGVQRAGTSWWYRLIVAHPEVERVRARRRRLSPLERRRGAWIAAPREGTATKELHFFGVPEGGRLADPNAALYERFFPRPAGAIAGEWTPDYMREFWAAPLLRAAAPRAKLIAMLRNPIERFRSGIGRAAGASDEWGHRLPVAAWADALQRSRYGEQLATFARHFGRERLLVLQYERCREHPEAELRRTYEFLGLEDVDHVPAGLRRRVGSAHPTQPIDERLRAELVEQLRADVLDTLEIAPEIDIALWEDFA